MTSESLAQAGDRRVGYDGRTGEDNDDIGEEDDVEDVDLDLGGVFRSGDRGGGVSIVFFLGEELNKLDKITLLNADWITVEEVDGSEDLRGENTDEHGINGRERAGLVGEDIFPEREWSS